MKRCSWCKNDKIYIKYHDEEWGVPVFDDNKHFEFLILESAQAGLNWLTILKKRENYKKAYENFNPVTVANFNNKKFEELIQYEGIIKNKKKIKASINNAQKFIEIQTEFGSFNHYIWKFVNYQPINNLWNNESEIPSKTKLSEVISKDLKKRGFKFIGPVIIYSYLQAMGLVNDHIVACFRHKQIKNLDFK
ncbi:DNA-3-methyladenine glycosylase I [Anaerophilus nitritogenes]|uniref:DNA-3-methyladenine glycosylase I n=1 Tax=Anaerophilus nitritogenes TaxID=2498136 RepID=UPI00101BC79A|nr:DNA-3-methyladenine glycosylase I [Anaerophilus nitritogenes]